MSVINSQPLIGASGNQSTAYNLTRSLRFRSSASAYLNRTIGTPTSGSTWTISFWMKRGAISSSNYMYLFSYDNTASNGIAIASTAATTDAIYAYNATAGTTYGTTARLLRDPSSWYHIVFSCNAGTGTLYVNNQQQLTISSMPSMTNGMGMNIGRLGNGNQYFFDGYLTETNFIDGQALTPTSFGSTNAATGVWQPVAYTGTYGTNGFYLKFTDTSSTAALGTDYSGNSNTWTVNNISLTAGSTYDSMTDVPTLTSATTANYAVLNPLLNSPVLTNGNLQLGYNSQWAASTLGVTTGKFYFEATILSQNTYNLDVGVVNQNHSGSVVGASANSWGIIVQSNSNNGDLWNNGTTVASGVTFTTNDVVNVAFDIDAGKIWFGKNGTWVQSGNPATATNPQYTNLSGTIFGAGSSYQNSGGSLAFNFGQQGFKYTPPTGYVALNTFNLPTPTIGATASTQANKYFDATLFSSTGSSQSITNTAGFKPDFIWQKNRTSAQNHYLVDSVRGVANILYSDSTSAEGSAPAFVTAINSTGWTQNGNGVYTNGNNIVGWQWQAGQGTTSSNTQGSITSTVSANTTAGFSIVTYTGTGANATVGHGLGVAPSMIIVKSRTNAYDWVVYNSNIGNTKKLYLNLTDGSGTDSTAWNNTSPTSTVFSLGSNVGVNQSSSNHVAYCFAEVAGYSAFGSYTGNGSTDGPFVFTGFRPKYILWKNTTSGSADGWYCYDSVRQTYNAEVTYLSPNSSNAEGSNGGAMDFLSNGFKIRNTGSDMNTNGSTYIYAAFAESPFKYSLAR